MRTVLGLLVALAACQAVCAIYGYPGYGYGGGYGYPVVEECVEPVIPVSSGVVDVRSYVDSYFPGSSYCGYGTYGPAYGGGLYPLPAYGYPGPFGVGYGGYGYGGYPGFGYGPY